MIIKALSSKNVAFGSGSSSARNSDFFLSSVDYSFVGRVQGASVTKLVTAISDTYVVAAKHYKVVVGDVIAFVNKLNEAVYVKVARIVRATGDVQVVEVDQSLSSLGISYAEVTEINPGIISQFLNKLGLFRKQAVAFGVNLATNEVTAANATVYSLVRANPANIANFRQGTDGVTLQPGDSGAPDFILENGKLKLVGVHSAINAAAWITSSAYWAV